MCEFEQQKELEQFTIEDLRAVRLMVEEWFRSTCGGLAREN